MIGSKLYKTGRYLPEGKLDNFQLFEKIDKSKWDVGAAKNSLMRTLGKEKVGNLTDKEVFNEYYLQLTGVSQRHLASEDETVEHLGTEAAKKTLEGDSPELVISPTFTSDKVRELNKIPNSGMILAHELENDVVAAFSINTQNAELVKSIALAFSNNGYKNILEARKEEGIFLISLITNGNQYLENANQKGDIKSKAVRLLQRGRINPSELELVIYSEVTEDAGSTIAKNLNAKTGLSVNAACSGFVYGVAIADSLIKLGEYSDVVVAAAEKMSKVTDFSDYKTLALFGDGAGAARFKATNKREDALSFFLGSRFSENEITLGIRPKEKIKMIGGREVVEKAVKSMEYAVYRLLLRDIPAEELEEYCLDNLRRTPETKEIIEEISERLKSASLIIPHDANQRIFKLLARRFSKLFDCPEDKFYGRIKFEGNISGATSAKNLDYAIQEGIVKGGDKVLITTTGGGYTRGSLMLTIPKD